MNEKAEYWINIAEYDLKAAHAMLKSKMYLYVGFMCHQTIEKSLKAVIARDCADGEVPPKIHHLLKLADRAELFRKMSPEQQKFLKRVNPMNIEARYPKYKEQISAELSNDICAQIIMETEELLCWIKEQL